MQHVSAPPALTSDPQRLMEEFPRWLEKVSAKIPGGIILILDSGDRFLVSMLRNSCVLYIHVYIYALSYFYENTEDFNSIQFCFVSEM